MENVGAPGWLSDKESAFSWSCDPRVLHQAPHGTP